MSYSSFFRSVDSIIDFTVTICHVAHVVLEIYSHLFFIVSFVTSRTGLFTRISAMEITVAVLGDHGCGKTALLQRILSTHLNKVEKHGENLNSGTIGIKGKEVIVKLVDIDVAANRTSNAPLRSLQFTTADVLLLCFALDNRESFDAVSSHWLKEIEQVAVSQGRTMPKLVLVGCKLDCRPQSAKTTSVPPHISEIEGKRMGRTIGASGYIECSAHNGTNVLDVLRQATTDVSVSVSCCALV